MDNFLVGEGCIKTPVISVDIKRSRLGQDSVVLGAVKSCSGTKSVKKGEGQFSSLQGAICFSDFQDGFPGRAALQVA